jgi:prepilin-type processing-associated H-X9-DG protein
MTQPVTVYCPHCGQAYSMLPGRAGQTVQCTQCQKIFTAGVPGSAPAAQPGPGATYVGNYVAGAQPGAGTANVIGNYAGPGQVPGYAAPGGFAQAGAYVPPPQGNGIATAGLVMGILSFCIPLVCSLLAIIFGIIGITRAKDGRGGKGLGIAAIVLGIISLLFMPAILLPALNRARETANRVKCGNQMQMIGVAINSYQSQHRGQNPPNLNALVSSGLISNQALVCPSDNNTSGQPSYILAPPTRLGAFNGTSVLLYEPVSDHADGANFLYGDGHVNYVTRPQADTMISHLQSGMNPP